MPVGNSAGLGDEPEPAGQLVEPDRETPDDEKSQVKEWLAKTVGGEDWQAAVDRYWADCEAILGDDVGGSKQDTVTVNHLYRNAIQIVAMMVPPEHVVEWEPAELAEPLDGYEVPPEMREAFEQAQAELEMARHQAAGFAHVLQTLVRRLCAEIRIQEQFEAAIQDSSHFQAIATKCWWQKVFEDDPASNVRLADTQDNRARLRELEEAFARGDFTEDDAEHAELAQLRERADETERSYRVGLAMETHVPTTWRIDPRANGPEKVDCAEWWRFDYYWTKDECLAKYSELQDNDFDSAARYQQAPDGRITKTQAGDGEDRSAGEQDGKQPEPLYCVCEIWDLRSHTRFVTIDGMEHWVENETIDPLYRGRAPAAVLVLNRIHGRLYGFSDTQLGAKLAAAINDLRTDEEKDRRKARPRWVYDPAGIASEDAAQDINAIKPYEAGPINLATNKRIEDVFFPLFTNGMWVADLYDTTKFERELSKMTSLPPQALGETEAANFAEEVKTATAAAGTLSHYRQTRIERYLEEVYDQFGHLTWMHCDQELAVRLAGPMARIYWPDDTSRRQQLYEQLAVTVDVSIDEMIYNEKQITAAARFLEMSINAGMPLDPELLGKFAARYLGEPEFARMIRQDPNAAVAKLVEAVLAKPGELSQEAATQLVQIAGDVAAQMADAGPEEVADTAAAGGAPADPEPARY